MLTVFAAMHILRSRHFIDCSAEHQVPAAGGLAARSRLLATLLWSGNVRGLCY